MINAYIPAYLAQLFPKLADIYERISGKEIPYRHNKLIFSIFPERKSQLVGARFTPEVEKMLEQKAEIT